VIQPRPRDEQSPALIEGIRASAYRLHKMSGAIDDFTEQSTNRKQEAELLHIFCVFGDTARRESLPKIAEMDVEMTT